MIRPKNLLIVRTDRIGDVVLTLPLAGIIKKYYPDCKITFLVRKYTESLVRNHPSIDNILILKELNGKPAALENAKMISAYKFDSCIVVYPTFTIALIIYLSRISERIGTGYRWYSILFNNKVYQHRKYAEKHELEFNVQLLKNIGINEVINKSDVKFDLKISKEDHDKAESILRADLPDPGKKIILVHPGSGGSAIDLPVEKFIEIVQFLEKKNDYEIIITGSENEKKLCGKLQISEKVRNLAGMFNLGELTALISMSDLFISNSTGPIHIAAAMGKDTIGFYPKITACLPVRWGPYSNKSVVFTPEIDCSDCNREQCEKLNCMNSIDVNEVISVIETKLKNKAEN